MIGECVRLTVFIGDVGSKKLVKEGWEREGELVGEERFLREEPTSIIELGEERKSSESEKIFSKKSSTLCEYESEKLS